VTAPEYVAMSATFYAGDTLDIARGLVGRYLLSQIGGPLVGGRIVETEAYLEDDPASHSFRGPTKRNRAMFGPAGRAYVYRSYGVHWCMNVVTGDPGCGAAVLIRALEPVNGLDIMRARRGVDNVRLLCAGPGRLCQALAIVGDLDGVRLDMPPLWIGAGVGPRAPVVCSGRIGVGAGADRPFRFLEAGNPYVSRRRVNGPCP